MSWRLDYNITAEDRSYFKIRHTDYYKDQEQLLRATCPRPANRPAINWGATLGSRVQDQLHQRVKRFAPHYTRNVWGPHSFSQRPAGSHQLRIPLLSGRGAFRSFIRTVTHHDSPARQGPTSNELLGFGVQWRKHAALRNPCKCLGVGVIGARNFRTISRFGRPTMRAQYSYRLLG